MMLNSVIKQFKEDDKHAQLQHPDQLQAGSSEEDDDEGDSPSPKKPRMSMENQSSAGLLLGNNLASQSAEFMMKNHPAAAAVEGNN